MLIRQSLSITKRSVILKQGIDTSFNKDAYKGEYRTLERKCREDKQELEAVQNEIMPLKEIRYYVSKVIPIDEPAELIEQPKPSIVDKLKESKEKSVQAEQRRDEAHKRGVMNLNSELYVFVQLFHFLWLLTKGECLLNVFQAVKQAVTTRQTAESYGLEVSWGGMTCCPFHSDHNPSMKVDDRFIVLVAERTAM